MKLCSWGSRGVKYNIVGSTIQALKRVPQAKKEAFHRQMMLSVERFCYKPEFGLSLFSKNKVRPTFGVRSQLPETLSQKCTGLPLQPPTRTRSARVRCFSFFAFTSST